MINLIIPTLIIAILAIMLSLAAIIMVLAQKLSTHKIEWRPLVQQTAEIEAEEGEKFDDEEDSKFLKDALNLQRSGKAKVEDPLDNILSTSNF
jgi:hypothetical protein